MTAIDAKPSTPIDDTEKAGALVGRFFGSLLGALELFTVEIGLRLGLYDALATGPASADELAARSGIDTRYAQEWLEQQASAAIIDVIDNQGSDDAENRRFSLPTAHAAALLDADHPFFAAPIARLAAPVAPLLGRIANAYRTGEGIPFGDYGETFRAPSGLGNRTLFLHNLAQVWLPAIPDIHDRLQTGARIAEVGCGTGWAAIILAQSYPNATVDGFDLDAGSIADARRHAAEAGVADRVRFEQRNAADAPPGTYDLVYCFEALHDMAHPVAALRAMATMAGDDGAILLADEAVADDFIAPGDETERFLYAASVLHCLPVGRSEPGSAATGTMLRLPTLQRYATAAGLGVVEPLPIDAGLLRLYRLGRKA